MWVYIPEQHVWNSSILLLISGKLWVAMRVEGFFSESEEEKTPQVPNVRQGKQDSSEVLSTPRSSGDKACWDTSSSILCLKTFAHCSVLAQTPAVLVTGDAVCRRNNSSLFPPVSTRSRGDINHRYWEIPGKYQKVWRPPVSLGWDVHLVPDCQWHLHQHNQVWWEQCCLLVSVTEWNSLSQESHPSVAATPLPGDHSLTGDAGGGQGCSCHSKAPWEESGLGLVQSSGYTAWQQSIPQLVHP